MFVGLKHSNSPAFYTETSQKMEKWIKIVHVLSNVSPVLYILPVSMVSFIKYFTTDLGGSAFELPFPMW